MDHLAILEVLPSCVWISFSMCLHLCCLNFPSTSSWTKSWSQSLLHVVVASFNSSLSHCCLIFTNFFLSIFRTEPVLKYCSIAKCTNFPFQRVLIRRKLIPNKRVMSILSQRCNLSRRISECATSNVLAISPCSGLEIHWSWMRWNGNLMELLNINFLLLVQLWTCSQIDENSCVLLGFRRCWRSWLKFFWSWTHESASSCLQNILNTHYPGVSVGSRNKCQQTYHS